MAATIDEATPKAGHNQLTEDKTRALLFQHKKAYEKALADKKKELFDGDIEAIVLRTGEAGEGPWKLVQLWASATSGEASADVKASYCARWPAG